MFVDINLAQEKKIDIIFLVAIDDRPTMTSMQFSFDEYDSQNRLGPWNQKDLSLTKRILYSFTGTI
jgi:hypothetical protein